MHGESYCYFEVGQQVFDFLQKHAYLKLVLHKASRKCRHYLGLLRLENQFLVLVFVLHHTWGIIEIHSGSHKTQVTATYEISMSVYSVCDIEQEM